MIQRIGWIREKLMKLKLENLEPFALGDGYVSDAVDIRICFAIAWFLDETKADAFDAYVRQKGFTYNGGWMHGVACGRDKSWDATIVEDGRKLYAVTF